MSEKPAPPLFLRRLSEVSWGVLLIWVGIALWLQLGWGVALIGIGVIALAAQAVRGVGGLGIEWFAVVLGGLFLVGGAWIAFDVQAAFLPIIAIVAGITLLLSALRPHANS